MTARPVPAALPALSLSGLRDLLYSQPRACVEDPGLFFGPDGGETPAEQSARVAEARTVCEDCPVRLACTAFALRTRQPSGVWGGYDADAGELNYLEAAARHPFRHPGRLAAPEVAA